MLRQNKAPQRSRWKARYFSDFLISLLSIVVFFLLFICAEWGVRSFEIAKKGNQAFYREWMNLLRAAGPFQPKAGEINSLGFHSDEFNFKKSRGTFRILVVGGSATYGWKEIETSWTWFLSESLKKKYPHKNIEVINGGMPGATTNEEYSNLKNWVWLKPDLVLSFDGWNDIYYSHYCSEEWADRVKDFGVQSDVEEIKNRFLFKLETSSYLFSKMERGFYEWRKKIKNETSKHLPDPSNRIAGSSGASPYVPPDVKSVHCKTSQAYEIQSSGVVPDRFSVQYEKNLIGMSQLLKKERIPFVIFLQPDLTYQITKKSVPAEIENSLKTLLGAFYADWYYAVQNLYPKAEDVIRILSEKKIRAYNLSSVLNSEKAGYFADSVHVKNPLGLQIIADKIEQILDHEGLLKPLQV